MLPPASASTRSIVGVADDLLQALRGESATLAPARSVVLMVIDGLGAISLRAHAGHARALTADMAKRDVALSVFPTTTAAALTSLLTGVWPGEHGLVGYRVLNPQRDHLTNQLTGWESDGIDPGVWQQAPTIFERATSAGHPAFAIGFSGHAGSGFSRATLRGAQFVAAGSIEERVQTAYELADQHPGSFTYCYLPDVDKAGHKHGEASQQWVAALEAVDSALSVRIPDRVGVLVTSDHGMVDVPAHRHLVLDAGDSMRDGVRHIGGEPRMLHVYLEADAATERVLHAWRTGTEGAADVLTREQAVGTGLYGPVVTDDSASRIGDLVVIARGRYAAYDAAEADQRGRGMVGQHGALTAEELQVPWLRFGAFRR